MLTTAPRGGAPISASRARKMTARAHPDPPMTVFSPLHLSQRRVLVALASFLGCVLATPARADVLVVDAAGGGQYTDIQSAVLAAQDGDVVLVRTGVYGPFDVRAKALDIVAYEGADVRVVGTTRVRAGLKNY